MSLSIGFNRKNKNSYLSGLHCWSQTHSGVRAGDAAASPSKFGQNLDQFEQI